MNARYGAQRALGWSVVSSLFLTLAACGGGGGGGGEEPPPGTIVQITSAAQAACTTGEPFSYRIEADVDHGVGATTYGATNLPAGLSLSGQQIVGTCPNPGSYSGITISATNNGITGSSGFTVVSSPAPSAQISIAPGANCPGADGWVVASQGDGFIPVCSVSIVADREINASIAELADVSGTAVSTEPSGNMETYGNGAVSVRVKNSAGTVLATGTLSGGKVLFSGASVSLSTSATTITFEVDLPDGVAFGAGKVTKVVALRLDGIGLSPASAATVSGNAEFRHYRESKDLYQGGEVSSSDTSYDLVRHNSDTGTSVRLTNSFAVAERDMVVRGGKVVFADFNGGAQLNQMNVDGTGHSFVPLFSGCVNPQGGISVDPTLTYVTYAAECSGVRDILISRLDGGSQCNLTQDANLDYAPAVSPDGTRILWFRSSATGMGYYRATVNFATCSLGSLELVLGGSWNDAPNSDTPFFRERHVSYSPNGSQIVVTRYTGTVATIIRASADGTNAVELGEGNNPQWTSDGRILFTDGIDPGARIGLMDRNGENRRLLPPDLSCSGATPVCTGGPFLAN